MKIVEQAKAEQLANSGALHGGKTARFLAETGAENADLLSRLTEEPKPIPAKNARVVKTKEKEVTANVLAELSRAQEPVVEKPRTVPIPKPVVGVDRGMLDGLMGNDSQSGGSGSS